MLDNNCSLFLILVLDCENSLRLSRNGSSKVEMRYVTMSSYFIAVISLLSVSLISPCKGESDADAYLSRFIADLWLEGADVVKIIWRDCSKKVCIVSIPRRYS